MVCALNPECWGGPRANAAMAGLGNRGRAAAVRFSCGAGRGRLARGRSPPHPGQRHAPSETAWIPAHRNQVEGEPIFRDAGWRDFWGNALGGTRRSTEEVKPATKLLVEKPEQVVDLVDLRQDRRQLGVEPQPACRHLVALAKIVQHEFQQL